MSSAQVASRATKCGLLDQRITQLYGLIMNPVTAMSEVLVLLCR
jgi:hypothetical protein